MSRIRDGSPPPPHHHHHHHHHHHKQQQQQYMRKRIKKKSFLVFVVLLQLLCSWTTTIQFAYALSDESSSTNSSGSNYNDAGTVTATTDADDTIRCRWGYHPQDIKFECYNTSDGAFYEERRCAGRIDPLMEYGEQICILRPNETVAYGDWIGACRINPDFVVPPSTSSEEEEEDGEREEGESEDKGEHRQVKDDTDLVLCEDRRDPTDVVCRCNSPHDGTNGYVDCYRPATNNNGNEEEEECFFARYWCDHEQVCVSGATAEEQPARARSVPIEEWYLRLCQIPTERDVSICEDVGTSKEQQEEQANDSTAAATTTTAANTTTPVQCKCRGIGNEYDCYGPDGCLASRHVCAPDERCISEDYFPYNNNNNNTHTHHHGACVKGYISSDVEVRENGPAAASTPLDGLDAFFYCIRPGAVSCTVTSINNGKPNNRSRIDFGIFGVPYGPHRDAPWYSKILQHDLVHVGQEFRAYIQENSYGLMVEYNNGTVSTGSLLEREESKFPNRAGGKYGTKRIFSDPYLNNLVEAMTATWHPSNKSTTFTFYDIYDDEKPLVLSLECEGFRPLTFFNGGSYSNTIESCERDAEQVYTFREWVWPPFVWELQRELKLLAILGFVSGSLSMLGSGFLIFAVLVRIKDASIRERLILGMSVIDFISSTSLMLGPIPSPDHAVQSVDAGDAIWTFGTTASCSAQGWGIQMGFAVPLYNSSLCIYYLMILVFFVPSIPRWVEAIFHLVPVGFGLVTASMGVAREIFNSNGRLCYIEPSPYDCPWNENIECTRGSRDETTRYLLTFGMLPVLVSFGCIFISMTWISFSECTRYIKERKLCSESAASRQRHRQVFIQACLYVFGFLVTYVWALLEYSIYWSENFYTPWWLKYVKMFFWPLQGFWNFLIFIRPTYSRTRGKYPDKWCWWVFVKALKLESTQAEANNALSYKMRRNASIIRSSKMKFSSEMYSTPSFFHSSDLQAMPEEESSGLRLSPDVVANTHDSDNDVSLQENKSTEQE